MEESSISFPFAGCGFGALQLLGIHVEGESASGIGSRWRADRWRKAGKRNAKFDEGGT